MEDIGAQVASPIYIHQSLGGRFSEQQTMAKKRTLSQNFQYQQHQLASGYNWNPKAWDWNSANFVAKPLESNGLHNPQRENERENHDSVLSKGNQSPVVEDDESLKLQLGGGSKSSDEPVSRPNKKVRSGSPGSSGGNYPMCQVDDCREDLSNAKDYHRRHKVCEIHSKATKALVGKQMQRFCQQCSRFHPLSEFDEGKRSCRRRLAGHNKRRRKTQAEDASSRTIIPTNQDNTGKGDLDIVNLLTVLARMHGNKGVESSKISPVPNKEQLMQMLSKINPVPSPVPGETQLSGSESLNGKSPGQLSPDNLSTLKSSFSPPPTKDFLGVLSSTLTSSNPDKAKLALNLNVQDSSSSYQSPGEDSDCQVQEIRSKLPLQLFSSSPENDSLPKVAASGKYFSSDSSNPMSPSSSPPIVQKLFPIQATREIELERLSGKKEVKANVRSLELFGGSDKCANSGSCQTLPNQAGYTSSSGSDHSPSSLNSDAQDRTGRIVFKLFGKDPSHLPQTLRSQIHSWLCRSPSEMESYIRPGCVVLTIYVSMSSSYWEQLEQNLLQYVNFLIRDPDTDFWRSGKFLVQAGTQLVSYNNGKLRLCKSWNAPELISVSPLAVVAGQEATLLLRGCNLNIPGTRIHCTNGGHLSEEVRAAGEEPKYDEINLLGFRTQETNPGVLGRCFIEVENGFKGASFPVIIANATICQELRLLESEFYAAKINDTIDEDQIYDSGRPRSQDEVLHFLNELGWLFQRKRNPQTEVPDFKLDRFKFLFIFTIERDCCALVSTLLGMFLPNKPERGELSRESIEMLSDIHLLNRAVKRRCRKMVDLLINYVFSGNYGCTYMFPPNLVGPGGITPLHLAASMSGGDDIVDALTSDPQEIGLQCWNSLLDANKLSPYAYALMQNNHSCNTLVARKLANKKNNQVSITINNQTEIQENVLSRRVQTASCSKCATIAKYSWSSTRSRGLLNYGPAMISILAIAAVCVCVCILFRGDPEVSPDEPLKWENVGFGSI